MTDKPWRIMLVAGEVSGDRIAAQLMAALRKLSPRSIEFLGVGGMAMQDQGLTSLHDLSDTAVVGIWDVFKRLPLLLRRIRATADFALQANPDMLILVDSPDFTHRIARRVRKRNKDISILDYVAPTVWAWRRRRAIEMRRYIDHVLALLPFEEEVFRNAGGPACSYVGHPALEEVGSREEGEAFRHRHDISPKEYLVALLPGSRRGEVLRHTNEFVNAGFCLSKLLDGVRLVLLGREELREIMLEKHRDWGDKVLLLFGEEERRGLFASADVALAAVGTVALELGLARVPMVVALRESAINAWIGEKVLRIPSLCLVNLVLDAPAVSEYLQEDMQREKMALALKRVLVSPGREEALENLEIFRAAMEIAGEPPSERAASLVLRLLKEPTASDRMNV